MMLLFYVSPTWVRWCSGCVSGASIHLTRSAAFSEMAYIDAGRFAVRSPSPVGVGGLVVISA